MVELKPVGHHLHYRPDIDGLRAIAVVPVVLFHAGVANFSGGYVGVDVFFVISGYLITSILASEIAGGSFSILTFYQRRIRRIFPALVAVMSFCILAGYFLFTPSDYQSLGKSVLAASFFVSNIFFWKSVGYFAGPASEMPLLHTWSLAIEEQFYFFFPIFLYLLSRHFRRGRIPAIALVCLVSLIAAAVLVNFHPRATFFLGFSRAWELLVGCLIALGAMRLPRHRAAKQIAAFGGLTLILAPVFLYTAATKFPGLAALPPVLGTALLILSGQEDRTPVHAMLSTRPFTAIGKTSYSLYLWHFPLLAFGKYVTLGELGPIATVGICLASVLISFASFRFIERPFRVPITPVQIRRLVTVAAAGLVLVAAFGGLADFAQGLPRRLDPTAQRILDAERDISRHHMECMSLENKIVPPQRACKLGTAAADPHMLLWGDSHAVVTATALQAAAMKHHAAFYFAASVDCPIGLGFSISSIGAPSFVGAPGYQYCGRYNAGMLDFATQHRKLKVIVLSSRWSNWRIGAPGSPAETPVDIRLQDSNGVAASPLDNRRIFGHGFESLLQKLTAAGKTVWIVGPVPLPRQRVPQALFVEHLGFAKLKLAIPHTEYEIQNHWILTFFKRIAARYPVRFVWPDAVLCQDKTCPVSEDGKPLYFDDNHLSVFGALKTANLYNALFRTDAIKSVVSKSP